MITDAIGQSLHDRATRGEVLSVAEQAQLHAWYTRHDEEEILGLATRPVAPNLAELQVQVKRAASQLVTQAQRIQALTDDNERLRQEIAVLEQQLSEKVRVQPA